MKETHYPKIIIHHLRTPPVKNHRFFGCRLWAAVGALVALVGLIICQIGA